MPQSMLPCGLRQSPFEALGIAAQVIPQNDMYIALQTGVVDCAYYLSSLAPTVSLQEVAPYERYLHPWAVVPRMFGITEASWSRLTPELQETLVSAGDQIWRESAEAAVDPEREAATRVEREAIGAIILEPFADEEVTQFLEAANQAWKKLAERAGPTGVEYYERVQAAMKEAQSN